MRSYYRFGWVLFFGACLSQSAQPAWSQNAGRPCEAPKVVQISTSTSLWGTPEWDPGPMTLKNVGAGNALIFLFAGWVSTETNVAPLDTNGTWLKGVDTADLALRHGPPVYTQIYYQLNVQGGTHVITPQFVGKAGDGRTWVLEVSGLQAVRAFGGAHRASASLTDLTVTPTPNATQKGDFLVAIGVEDADGNFTRGTRDARFAPIHTNSEWSPIGSQQETFNNVGCDARFQIAPTMGPTTLTWSWPGENFVNVASGAMMAFQACQP